MPNIRLSTNNGSADFCYHIATPKDPLAETIDPNLPTVFFIHPSYVCSEIFEPQFADPQLRRFNLVSMDLRGYGGTKGRVDRTRYTPVESADDVYNMMKAISLPPLHLVGLAMGSCVALELASRHPEQVLSLTLWSPLTPTEPEPVVAGRLELYQLWVEAHKFSAPHNSESDTDDSTPVDVDMDCLRDLVFGAAQLLFNNRRTRLIEAMTWLAVRRAQSHWAGSRIHLNEAYKTSVAWHLEREPISDAQLLKITCPVVIIHFAEDIAYPLKHSKDLAERLKSAEIQPVPIHEFQGAHLGSFTDPQQVNSVLNKMVASVEHKLGTRPIPDLTLEGAQRTPFSEALASEGYDPFSLQYDSDMSDDSDM